MYVQTNISNKRKASDETNHLCTFLTISEVENRQLALAETEL